MADDNGGPRGGYTLEALLADHGPYFPGEPPTNDALFDRLDGFGPAWWRLESRTQREYAREIWVKYLGDASIDSLRQPWRIVQAAIDAGRSGSASAGAPTWHSLAELRQQPDRADLVEGYIPENSLACLYGGPGSCKTFVANGLGMAVVFGLDWHGHPVARGKVLYIAAEGGGRIISRFDAWLMAHDFEDTDDVRVVTEPVQFMDPHGVDALIQQAEHFHPQLVVIDTLARCMVGGDENSAKDMGEFIHGTDRLRQATGACVLLVHHTRKDGDAERGSVSLRGAADTMLKVRHEDGIVTIECDKQKDGVPPPPMRLRLDPHGASCVLRRTSPSQDSDELSAKEYRALEALIAICIDDDGVPSTAWESVSESHGISRSTFYRVRKSLIDRGVAAKQGKRFVPTPSGLQLLNPNAVPF